MTHSTSYFRISGFKQVTTASWLSSSMYSCHLWSFVGKKRWQEYTEELCRKDLSDPDNHSGVITHLEPDILECKIKWALGSITMNKASGGDGIPVELLHLKR